jgi:hypothetical protein
VPEGEAHSLAGEGGGGSQFQRGNIHCSTLGIYVLCEVATLGQCLLSEMNRAEPFYQRGLKSTERKPEDVLYQM